MLMGSKNISEKQKFRETKITGDAWEATMFHRNENSRLNSGLCLNVTNKKLHAEWEANAKVTHLVLYK